MVQVIFLFFFLILFLIKYLFFKTSYSVIQVPAQVLFPIQITLYPLPLIKSENISELLIGLFVDQDDKCLLFIPIYIYIQLPRKDLGSMRPIYTYLPTLVANSPEHPLQLFKAKHGSYC